MENDISEIEIYPVKPYKGLIAFVSFVFNENWYMGNIGVITRPDGGIRLVYPKKNDRPCYFPISKAIGTKLEKEVMKKFEEVMKYD